MTVRSLLHYTDKRLRQPAEAVRDFGPEFQKLVDDMIETMYAAVGVGLAAPQIGVSLRLFVLDLAEEGEPSDPRVFVNPSILERHGQLPWTEGCLSFPGARERITRSMSIKVHYRDREGFRRELVPAGGLASVAIQHEIDHLDGILMTDHMSPTKRRMFERKVR